MADLPRLPKFGETLMDRLETNPRAPLDAASVSWIDDAGNAYDNFGQKMWSGTASAQPQSWSEWGINALQAPVRIGASLLDSINPYHENEHPITEPDASNWRVPPLATETWNAITAPGRAYYDGMSPEEMQHTAATAAGLMMGGGGLAARPAGSTGMFAGRLAKTADHAALAKAEELAAKGADRNAIWNETGWFQGPDQKWRFEIDDSKAKFAAPGSTFADVYASAQGFKGMGDVLDHSGLFQAYPGLGDMGVGLSSKDGPLGSFGGRGANDIEVRGSSLSGEALETMLHEGQHAIQATESFAQGGNSEIMAPAMNSRKAWEARLPSAIRAELDDFGVGKIYASDDRWPTIKEGLRQRIEDDIGKPFRFRTLFDGIDEADLALEEARLYPAETLNAISLRRLKDLGLDGYERLAGEVEARNVQSRMNMSAEERRATPPWETQDIPDADQIVRLYSNASKEAGAGAIANALDENTMRTYHGGPGSNPYFDNGAGSIERFKPGADGAVWSTDNAALAGDYASARYPDRPAVYPLDVSFENPYVVDRSADFRDQRKIFEDARQGGHDGIIFKNSDDSISGLTNRGDNTQFAALRPGTIRNALTGDVMYSNASKESALPALANALDERPGIIAYHGSPHDFDKFDLSKIGTGEGAQAYGHGLYFAENEGVAKSYRDGLSKWNPQIDGSPIIDMWANGTLHHKISKMTDLSIPDAQSAGNWVAEAVRSGKPLRQVLDEKAEAARRIYPADLAESEIKRIEAIGEKIAPIAPETYSGHMYQVRINANPEDFLDWDKPLSQQSEKVRDGTKQALLERGLPKQIADYLAASDRSARDAMSALARGVYDTRLNVPDGEMAAQASSKLREAGIPGIRYLDQMSRGAGDGSRNLVVFDDNLIEILKKYGWLAPGANLGSNALSQGQDNQY